MLHPDEGTRTWCGAVTEVLTSFGVSLYSCRSARNWAERALRSSACDVDPASPRAAR